MTAVATPTPTAPPAEATPVSIESAPAPEPGRPRVTVIGAALLSAAAFMLIVGMLGIYLVLRAQLRAQGGTWLPQGVIIPLTQTNTMLFTLLMSSATIQWAVAAIREDDRRHTYLALGVSLLFAFAFLNEAAYLYSIMGLNVAGNAQSVLIYTISGTQLVMTVVAMIAVVIVGFRSLGGQYTSQQHDAISAAALFWQVSVAAYVLIWFAIYVTK